MNNAIRKAGRTYSVNREDFKVWLTVFPDPRCKGPREETSLNIGAETNFSLFQGGIKFSMVKFLCDYVFSSMGPMGSIRAVCRPTSFSPSFL